MFSMQVQPDDAAQADRLVMDFLQTHGPTTMEGLIRSVVTAVLGASLLRG